MSYLSKSELYKMDFEYLGNDVKISDKASLDKTHLMSIGHRSRIDDFCAVSGSVKLGNNVFVAVHSSLTASLDPITLDDFSTLAFNCQVFSGSDDYSGESMTNPTVPERFKNAWTAPIFIGRHVILGASSIVFPGCVIADGCSIGAGSIVMSSTRPWGVYAGVPAKRIKERSTEVLALQERYLHEFPYENDQR